MSFRPYDYFGCECPRNALGFINNKGFLDAVDMTFGIVGAVIELLLIVLLIKLYFQVRGEGGHFTPRCSPPPEPLR